MRGEVLYYDDTQGFGFIHGADGNRYTFTAEDLRRRTPLAKGAAVEFRPTGDKARDIFSTDAPSDRPADGGRVDGRPEPGPAAVSAAAASLPPHFGRLAEHEAIPSTTSLWGYFWRALTANYVNFSGRARRKEYWGYFLFWMLALVALCFMALVLDAAIGNFDNDFGAPVATMALCGLFVLATFLPGLGLTIRRIHDIGLSGWFYLLVFVPSVGALIILVFTLVASQKHDNKWGPVPEGIKI